MELLDLTVSEACWRAAGAPAPSVPETRALPGPVGCARCGGPLEVRTLTSRVVSKRFTDWDHWRTPGGRWVCAACAWIFTTDSLRRQMREVTATPSSRELSPVGLHHRLMSGVPASTAVILPLKPGRKHLIAHAEWGKVCVDDAVVSWTKSCADRLEAMTRLREFGFSVRQLKSHSPTYQVMIDIQPGLWPQIMTEWGLLDSWRQDNNPYWEIAVRASSPRVVVVAA